MLPEVPNLSPRFALGHMLDGSLSGLIDRYFENGYDDFDRLCRSAYAEILPNWDCVVVPWEQILSERSESWKPDDKEDGLVDIRCSACGASKFGTWKGQARINEAPLQH